MPTSPNLMYAILAMDAYNRGYNPGIDGLLDTSNGTVQIGTATITKNIQDAQIFNEAQAAGGYAVAYTWNGDTIMASRRRRPWRRP